MLKELDIQNGVPLSQQPSLRDAAFGLIAQIKNDQGPTDTKSGCESGWQSFGSRPKLWLLSGMMPAIEVAMGHQFDDPSIPVTPTPLLALRVS